MTYLKALLLVLFGVALSGVALSLAYQAATDKRADKGAQSIARMAHQQQATKAIVSAGPQAIATETPQGTVIDLTIPKVGMGGAFIETRKCVVWRDAVTKTASMFCDPQELDPTPLALDLPDPVR